MKTMIFFSACAVYCAVSFLDTRQTDALVAAALYSGMAFVCVLVGLYFKGRLDALEVKRQARINGRV